MIQQIIRAGRLDRSFYSNLLFDDYAIGNGIVIAVVVSALPSLLPDLNIYSALSRGVFGLIGAALVGAIAWLIANRMFQRDSRIQTTIRLTLFAHVCTLPIALSGLFPRSFSPILFLAGMAWLFFAMAVIAREQFDLQRQEAQTLAGLSVLGRFVLYLFGF